MDAARDLGIWTRTDRSSWTSTPLGELPEAFGWLISREYGTIWLTESSRCNMREKDCIR